MTQRPPLPLVALGGALGTGLRLLVTALAPGGVLLANVTGSLALGVLVARTREESRLRWLLGPGLLGAYTTFSAFALVLAEASPGAGLAHATVSVGLGLGAAAIGLRVGRRR